MLYTWNLHHIVHQQSQWKKKSQVFLTRQWSRRTWACLPSKNTKITRNCWTTIDKKDWKLPKEIFYFQRQRKIHNEMVEGERLQYNQIPYQAGGQHTNWKIIILRRFSHRSESSQRHVRIPSMGVWHREEELPEQLALKASRAWS